jgi:hypothetical protein
MSRLDAIRKIVEQSPGDPFPRYGLAMELKNQKLHAEAREEFRALEARFPDYIPQYLMHGNLLVELKLPDEAKAVLTRGLAAARKKGDAHAAGEIESALAALE